MPQRDTAPDLQQWYRQHDCYTTVLACKIGQPVAFRDELFCCRRGCASAPCCTARFSSRGYSSGRCKLPSAPFTRVLTRFRESIIPLLLFFPVAVGIAGLTFISHFILVHSNGGTLAFDPASFAPIVVIKVLPSLPGQELNGSTCMWSGGSTCSYVAQAAPDMIPWLPPPPSPSPLPTTQHTLHVGISHHVLGGL